MLVIPALGREEQEEQEFKAILELTLEHQLHSEFLRCSLKQTTKNNPQKKTILQLLQKEG